MIEFLHACITKDSFSISSKHFPWQSQKNAVQSIPSNIFSFGKYNKNFFFQLKSEIKMNNRKYDEMKINWFLWNSRVGKENTIFFLSPLQKKSIVHTKKAYRQPFFLNVMIQFHSSFAHVWCVSWKLNWKKKRKIILKWQK